jgi:bifunctional ADP-heptose synthase (sugar kinase/adenylyltransferase)
VNWASILERFGGSRVLVVGDICLDRWCRYDPSEADRSRETGIARVAVVATEVSPAAGGTAACSAASLGAGKVAVIGAIGQDGFGLELERSLAERHIDYHLLVASRRIQTFTYTRLINDITGAEDKPRVDSINTRSLPDEVEDQLIANFHSAYQSFDIILISDQAESEHAGVISPAFREVLSDVAQRNPEKIVIADSRNHIELFRNAIAKPSRQEADRACLKLFGGADYARLRQTIGTKPLLVSDGIEGVSIVTEKGIQHIQADAPGDLVSTGGANDSFAAGFALALQATGDLETAARLGVLVSRVTIMKKGTGTASPAEVLERAGARARSA